MERGIRISARRGAFYLLLVLSALWISVSNAKQAQPAVPPGTPVKGTTSPNLSALSATLKQAVEGHSLAGVSLLLVQDGHVVFEEAYGNLSVTSRIRIASSTKPIATVGILLLVDDGKLSLDDTIGSLLPEFRGTPVEKATLLQLLSHQAGIRGDYPGGRPTTGSLADFSKLIARKGSLGTPGNFSYSGVSIDIACRMAEKAAGVPIEEHLKNRVWLPLEMTHSDFNMAADPRSVSSDERARGEGRYVSCGGGMESTLEDMANFYEMLLQGGVYKGKRLISKELYQQMISKHGLNPRKANDQHTTGEYGLGIYRDRVAADGTPLTISHGGALGTMPWADLDTGLVGVFFSQSRLRQVMPLISEVQAEARNEEFTATGAPAGAARPAIPQGRAGSGQGANGQRAPAQVFTRISGGADVISLEQFQDFIQNQTNNSRLKGQPEFVERLFKRLDENGDGVLTVEEYSEIQSLRR